MLKFLSVCTAKIIVEISTCFLIVSLWLLTLLHCDQPYRGHRSNKLFFTNYPPIRVSELGCKLNTVVWVLELT